MKKINIAPGMENMEEAATFFETLLKEKAAPVKVISQVNIVADEIFSNIAHYSGATMATLGCEVAENHVLVRFSDNGRPYDPTEKEDPDITLAAEDREIGGLGIFMVKKMMENVRYEYAGGFNILTMEKSW